MSAVVVRQYRKIMADLSVDAGEATEFTELLQQLQPTLSPDQVWGMRVHAFKVAAETMPANSSSHGRQVALLRVLNYLVHAIEQTCMQVQLPTSSTNMDEEEAMSMTKDFYQNLFRQGVISQNLFQFGFFTSDESLRESPELKQFFERTCPPASAEQLVAMRALAFKVASEHLEEMALAHQLHLLQVIHQIVHALETTCYQPKPFELSQAQVAASQLPSSTTSHATSAAATPNVSTWTLEQAIQHLWDLDGNRLQPDLDYKLNIQKEKKPSWQEDAAPEPLFSYVDPAIWQRPTYAAFSALLNNYQADTGEAETVTDSERREVQTLLDAILQSAPMQFCQAYGHAHQPSVVPSDRSEFRQLLYKIWFELYSRERGGRLDSSGFEHVFVGEVKNESEVSGFHNWIQFYLEEKAGRLDYRGCIKPRGHNEASADSNDHILTFQFRWKNVEKFVGTSLVGVSPEFEMALYTLCFLVGTESNEVTLHTGTDAFGLVIKCYRMAHDKIGTTYPEVTSHYKD